MVPHAGHVRQDGTVKEGTSTWSKEKTKTRTTKGKLTDDERSRKNPRTTEITGPEAE